MVEPRKHLRNVAIVLLLAAVVWKLPGGGTGAGVIGNVLSILLFGGLLFFGYRLYMEHRTTIFDLPDRLRTILYASVALAALALAATSRMWGEGGLYVLLWFALIGSAFYGVYAVFRWYREL